MFCEIGMLEHAIGIANNISDDFQIRALVSITKSLMNKKLKTSKRYSNKAFTTVLSF